MYLRCHTVNVRVLCLSWLTGDAVYMRSETKRQEYVLEQHGQVYRGTYKRIKGTPWNFGQVHKHSVKKNNLKMLLH